jgi:hypothetical protein
LFSYDDFNDVVGLFKDKTTLEYKGGTELLVTMVYIRDLAPSINYSEVRALEINQSNSSKFDLDIFIKDVINTARASPESTLSDFLMKRNIDRNAELAKRLLPRPFRDILGIDQQDAMEYSIRRVLPRGEA